jgi:hypothetical protein
MRSGPPTNETGWEEPLPLKTLYVGAAGVIWALDALRLSGHAETSLDLDTAASRTLELERAESDSTADEHWHPAALLTGETGPLLAAFRLAPDPTLADDLHAPRANVAGPTEDPDVGRTRDAARRHGMTQWTGEPHWQKARARRPLRYVPAAVTTVSGGRTTTFAWAGVRECHGGLN